MSLFDGGKAAREESAAFAKLPRKTLRDEFAMAALTGLVTMAYDSYGCHMSVEARVSRAYAHADAMMAERCK